MLFTCGVVGLLSNLKISIFNLTFSRSKKREISETLVARFARNVEWDFFIVFQTQCIFI